MDIKILENERYNRIIGNGSEGTVYDLGEKALKLFHEDIDFPVLYNKINKLFLLNQININGVVTPIELMVSDNGTPKGYTMEKIDTLTNMYIFTKSITFSLEDKIKKLKQMEELIIKIHENKITLGDMNLFNFLLNVKGELFAIDTDNYKIENYNNDIMPSMGFPYYYENISSQINENLDKFLFGIYIIRNLTNCDDLRLDQVLMDLYPNTNYIETYIEALEVNNEVKDMMIELIKKDGKFFYMPSKLDEMLPRQYKREKSFIEFKKVQKYYI